MANRDERRAAAREARQQRRAAARPRFRERWERDAERGEFNPRPGTQEARLAGSGHPPSPRNLKIAAGVAGGAAAIGGTAYLLHRSKKRKEATVTKALYDPFSEQMVVVEKLDNRKTNSNRMALGLAFPGVHGAIAGRKGKKLRSGGRELGEALGGGFVGREVGAAAGIGAAALTRRPAHAFQAARAGMIVGGNVGGYGGAYHATRSLDRKGYYKPIKKSASYPVAWPPPRSTGLQARTPSGKFVSHANDLKVVHYHPKRNPTSKLVQIKHGKRSVSGSNIGKALGSGAVKVGKRLDRV